MKDELGLDPNQFQWLDNINIYIIEEAKVRNLYARYEEKMDKKKMEKEAEEHEEEDQ